MRVRVSTGLESFHPQQQTCSRHCRLHVTIVTSGGLYMNHLSFTTDLPGEFTRLDVDIFVEIVNGEREREINYLSNYTSGPRASRGPGYPTLLD